MDDLKALYEEIGMPDEAAEALNRTETSISQEATEKLIDGLCGRQTFTVAAAKLKEVFRDDENGFKKLKLMLTAALKSRRLYESAGIGGDVFLDTMKCFSRFVREHREAYGRYGFDRDFWVGRQLSLCLFRLGVLEYETVVQDGEKAISVHIPSDADLSDEKLSASFELAKKFFRAHFPEYAEGKTFCYSWLLSPALEKLLPETSKILGFQRRFDVLYVNEDEDGYKQWVFKTIDLPPERFPENTTLQRNMKAYVLAGGKIGEAFGILR